MACGVGARGRADGGVTSVRARLLSLVPALACWARCGRPLHGFTFSNELGNPMNLEALARDVIRPALAKAHLRWHGWHAFRRGLATNLHRLGVSDKVIQQILRHANVSTTMNI